MVGYNLALAIPTSCPLATEIAKENCSRFDMLAIMLDGT
jgi:hypothetical protein